MNRDRVKDVYGRCKYSDFYASKTDDLSVVRR